MTRTHWILALAAAPLLAGCPPTYMGTTGTDTDEESGTTAPDSTSSGTNPTTGDMLTTGTTSPTGPTSTTTPETSSTTDVTTGEPGCNDDAQCTASDPNKPFCVNKECVSCEATAEPDTACAGVDPATPVCALDSGACVVCTPDNATMCMGTTPVCSASNECAACTSHDQCPQSACNQESGACFAPDYVIWVDAAAQCDLGDGSMNTPFCQIAQALQKMADNDPSLGWTIKIKTGNYTQTSLTVPDGSNVAIVGDGGVAKIKSTTASTLVVNGNSKVYLGKLSFNSNADDNGLMCTGSQIWGQDLNFSLNKQGYLGTDCSARFERTVFYKNTSGGLSMFGVGQTHVVNSYVSNNGSNAESNYGGLLTAQGHELHVVYSTVLNNLSETGARSLQCLPDAGPTEIRNSVVIAFVAPSIDCAAGLTITQSAVDEGKMDGDTNIMATMGDAMTWFDPQVSGVYKAKADSALTDLAVWLDGDPLTDFNGDARPGTPDATDYAGADRPAQ